MPYEIDLQCPFCQSFRCHLDLIIKGGWLYRGQCETCGTHIEMTLTSIEPDVSGGAKVKA